MSRSSPKISRLRRRTAAGSALVPRLMVISSTTVSIGIFFARYLFSPESRNFRLNLQSRRPPMRSIRPKNLPFWFASAALWMSLTMCSPSKTVDLYIHNVNGYTLQGDSLVRFNALAVNGGKVVAIGDSSELSDAHTY